MLGGGRNSSSNTLYFTAGPNDETNGLFGTITPATRHSFPHQREPTDHHANGWN
jgi:hypothetical protein